MNCEQIARISTESFISLRYIQFIEHLHIDIPANFDTYSTAQHDTLNLFGVNMIASNLCTHWKMLSPGLVLYRFCFHSRSLPSSLTYKHKPHCSSVHFSIDFDFPENVFIGTKCQCSHNVCVVSGYSVNTNYIYMCNR